MGRLTPVPGILTGSLPREEQTFFFCKKKETGPGLGKHSAEAAGEFLAVEVESYLLDGI